MASGIPEGNHRNGNGSKSRQETEQLLGVSNGAPKMWLSDLSIRQPVFVTMLVIAVLLVGWISYSRLSVELMPNISMQVISISTSYAGAAPAEVERSVSKPIEDIVASINGVKNVRSTSTVGTSTVSVEFDTNVDIQTAADEVRNRVGLIRNGLPADVTDPQIQKMDTSIMPVLMFGVADRSGSGTPGQLRSLVDNQLKPQIERLDGVGSVIVMGGMVPEVHVDADLAKLQALGVSPAQVSQAIRGESVDLPTGRVTEGGTADLLVRTAAKATSLEQLAEIPVTTPRGNVVKLKDLATISRSFADVTSYSRLDGQDSVMVIVMKQSGTNTVKVAENVQVGLKALQRQYPNLNFGMVFDQSTFTREAINDVQLTLILGAILAALVVLLFFRDLRNTLVTVAGLPVVLLGTFIALYALGISLNMISMMALALSVGFLIDDAIVVRENIFRHMEHGEEPKAAAGRGAAEIALAVLAVTSTIVAVFLPIAFVTGMVGQILRDFGITIVVAVLISLTEAFTLAPMLSAYFFHRLTEAEEKARQAGRFFRAFDALNLFYARVLSWALDHRKVVVGVGVLALAVSVGLVPLMKQSFQSSSDQGEFSVMMELQPGASLQESDRVARQAEQLLRAEPLISQIFTSVGSGGAANTAALGVKLKSRGHTFELLNRVRDTIGAALPGVRVSYNSQSAAAGAMSGAAAMTSLPLQYKVQGPDFAQLDQVSQELAARLAKIPGIVDVDRSIRDGGPQQVIVLDRARATDLGVSATQVASTLRTMVTGEKVGTFQDVDKDVNIVVRLPESDRDSLDKVLRLPVATTRGGQVPVSSIAHTLSSTEPAKIDRENRQRQVLVAANTTAADAGPALAAAQAAIASVPLPEGVKLVPGGQAQQTAEAFGALGMAMALSVAFMYMILASQFGSFVHPFTVMLALPFSVIGALLALLVTRFSLDAMSMIGMILLMGLVTKNSILLVEFTNQLRRRGLRTKEAILQAGPIRLRPILMTTLSMIFGMLPTAVGFGAAAEMRQPMAVSVIGGVITSTALTLVAVPVAYSLIDDFGRWLLRRFRRAPVDSVLETEAPAEPAIELR